MDSKQLKHMRRRELLEMLLLQSQEIDRLRSMIDELKANGESSTGPPNNQVSADVEHMIHLYMDQAVNVRTLCEKVEELRKTLESKGIVFETVPADTKAKEKEAFDTAKRIAQRYQKEKDAAQVSFAAEPEALHGNGGDYEPR